MSGQSRGRGDSTGLKNPALESYFVRGVKKLIKNSFKDWLLFTVVSNLAKFRVAEDPFIYAQKRSAAPEFADIYFNEEYLCELSSAMRPDEALAVIQFALLTKLPVKKKNGNLHPRSG